MTDTAYTPDQAAHLIGASTSTIRNWCKLYAPVLSDGANPPSGTERRLTTQDVATLQHVKAMRDDRVPPGEIIALLQAAASRNDAAPLTIDVTPTPQPPQTAQDARSEANATALALSSMMRRLEVVERNQDALIRAALVSGAIWGAVGATAVGALYLWIVYLTMGL